MESGERSSEAYAQRRQNARISCPCQQLHAMQCNAWITLRTIIFLHCNIILTTLLTVETVHLSRRAKTYPGKMDGTRCVKHANKNRSFVAVGGLTVGRGVAPQLWTAHPRGPSQNIPIQASKGMICPDLGEIGFGRGRGFSPVVFPAPLLLV